MRILGLDPGMASFGVAVIDVTTTAPPLLMEIGVITTKKSDKKRNLRQADDLSARGRTIFLHLRDLVLKYQPSVLAVEACAFPVGKARFSVVSQLGRVRGIVDAIAENWSIAIVEIFPQELKTIVAGDKKATKEQVQAALEANVIGAKQAWPTQKGLVEHAADALGAAVAAQESELVRGMLRAQMQWQKPAEAVSG